MPRAHRHILPGHVWHITHRCHRRQFLLKFGRDRRRYLHWLFEAKKRYGLCVLDYVITSNHIHLLVKDTGTNVIAQSMQLIAGRTAQEYNQRKNRQGAFWEDRYHATAVDANEHLHRCLAYIDLNMVRAGVVRHPGNWKESGYIEIQKPPERYAIIDFQSLNDLCGFADPSDFRSAHRQWVEQGLENGMAVRDERWSQAIAVGSLSFVERVKIELGVKATHRDVTEANGAYALREPTEVYGRKFAPGNELLTYENTFFWEEIVDEAKR